MAYDFEKDITRTPEERAAAHAEFASEMASWPYIPESAKSGLKMLELLGVALDVLQETGSNEDNANPSNHELVEVR